MNTLNSSDKAWARTLSIDIRPVAKGRHRFVSSGNGVRTYQDPKTRAYERELGFLLASNGPSVPLPGPIAVKIRFVMPRPQRLSRKKDPEGLLWHSQKPDLDNLIKAVLDAMTKGRWWACDSQVVRIGADKVFCEKARRPSIEMEVKALGNV